MQHHIKFQVPLPIISDLKCRHCSCFVSLGPVFVVPDGGILCGRCNRIAKPQFRNLAFEALAVQFLYPCYNWSRHCNAQLEWNEAVTHEPVCIFRSKCSIFWHHPTLLCKPERKISIHDDFQLQHVSDNILRHLQCDLCTSYLSCSPVYITEDGKNICHRCIHSNGIPEGVLRNLAYEKLGSVTIFPCLFRGKGCTMRLPFGRDLWKHETECCYGHNYSNMKSKKNHNGNANANRERGVIMTHSGHYYGTITPQLALWTPPRPEKLDPSIEVNKEFAAVIKKNIKNEHEDQLRTRCTNENENFARGEDYASSEGYKSPGQYSRRSSLSSEIFKKQPGEVTPKTPTNQQFFSRHDPASSSYNSIDDFPRYSVQHSKHQHQEIARPSLPGKTSYYKSNLRHSNHEHHHINSGQEEGMESNLRSSDYTSPINRTKRELIQPKRSDSFKVGNADVISELKLRQKLASIIHDGDGESVRSEDAMASITNSEGMPESRIPAH